MPALLFIPPSSDYNIYLSCQKKMSYFRDPMNLTVLLDTISAYLVSEEKNKKTYQLPEIIALRIDLASIRSQYPQTTLTFDGATSLGILVIA